MKKETTVSKTKVVKSVKADKEELSFNVFDKNGVFVRAYTSAVHGSEAQTLATMFANKISGEIK